MPKDERMYRDNVGGVVPQDYDVATDTFIVRANGVISGIDIGKTKLLRDELGGIVPNQIFDATSKEWIIGGGGSGGGEQGPPGPQGAEGKSAYQIALDGGFVGTEQQWLASLKGPQGDKGNDGSKGDNGIAGEKGERGIQGVQGIQGEQGEQGPPGIIGNPNSKVQVIVGSVPVEIDLENSSNTKTSSFVGRTVKNFVPSFRYLDAWVMGNANYNDSVPREVSLKASPFVMNKLKPIVLTSGVTYYLSASTLGEIKVLDAADDAEITTIIGGGSVSFQVASTKSVYLSLLGDVGTEFRDIMISDVEGQDFVFGIQGVFNPSLTSLHPKDDGFPGADGFIFGAISSSGSPSPGSNYQKVIYNETKIPMNGGDMYHIQMEDLPDVYFGIWEHSTEVLSPETLVYYDGVNRVSKSFVAHPDAKFITVQFSFPERNNTVELALEKAKPRFYDVTGYVTSRGTFYEGSKVFLNQYGDSHVEFGTTDSNLDEFELRNQSSLRQDEFSHSISMRVPTYVWDSSGPIHFINGEGRVVIDEKTSKIKDLESVETNGNDLHIRIPNSMSGWKKYVDDTFRVTKEDLDIYFNGWKIVNPDGSEWDGTEPNRKYTSIFHSNYIVVVSKSEALIRRAKGSVPWKVIYNVYYRNKNIKPVDTIGALTLQEGKNLLILNAGMPRRERLHPIISSDRVMANNYMLDKKNVLQHPLRNVVNIFKNRIVDTYNWKEANNWTVSNGRFYLEHNANARFFDNNDIYEIHYNTQDRVETSCVPKEVTVTYNDGIASVVKDNVFTNGRQESRMDDLAGMIDLLRQEVMKLTKTK